MQARFDLITYKPGWTWKVVQSPVQDCYIIHLTAVMVDADNFEEECRIGIPGTVRVDAKLMESDEALLDFARWMISDLERHEMGEFLRFRGEKIDNPHAKAA